MLGVDLIKVSFLMDYLINLLLLKKALICITCSSYYTQLGSEIVSVNMY